MDFIRFTGEWVVYATLLGLGAGVLTGLTAGAFGALDIDVDTVISRGKVVVDDGTYLGAKGDGRYLKRGLSQYLV